MKRIISYLLPLVLLTGCGEAPQAAGEGFCVTILPLRSIVRAIVGDDIPVEVLVPPGASPETFEPTPRQFAALGRAQLIFGVGLIDFETALLSKLERPERIVDLSRGIDPIAGSCSHSHHGRHPAHGVDPHVWTSPRELRLLAENAYRAIHALYPDSVKYTAGYERLQQAIGALDRQVAARIAASGRRSFLVYHPALTYYARAYGIRQIAIEEEGKEPSARRLSRLIREAKAEGITTVLYQKQFPESVVDVVAKDIGAAAVEFDPLDEELLANIDHITGLIAGERKQQAL